jgi:hypothetical protein
MKRSDDRANSFYQTAENAVKLIGDFGIVPGTSQILEGNIGAGVAHAAVGIAGRMFLGPIGWSAWVASASNSFIKSTTNKNIWTYFFDAKDKMDLQQVLNDLELARKTPRQQRTPFQNELIRLFGESLPASGDETFAINDLVIVRSRQWEEPWIGRIKKLRKTTATVEDQYGESSDESLADLDKLESAA